MKPDCYKCKFRASIPGDAHSECKNPVAIDVWTLIAMGGNPVITLKDGTEEPVISGDPNGIRNGWFAWPFNFDPVWLKTCYLYRGIET